MYKKIKTMGHAFGHQSSKNTFIGKRFGQKKNEVFCQRQTLWMNRRNSQILNETQCDNLLAVSKSAISHGVQSTFGDVSKDTINGVSLMYS